jgi:hypothetical protein
MKTINFKTPNGFILSRATDIMSVFLNREFPDSETKFCVGIYNTWWFSSFDTKLICGDTEFLVKNNQSSAKLGVPDKYYDSVVNIVKDSGYEIV